MTNQVRPATGVELIADERERQVTVRRWTALHDDEHADGELAMAAACYAAPDRIYVEERHANGIGFVDPWPWPYDGSDRRPTNGNVLQPNASLPAPERVRQLAKAGALIAAEIDRIVRVSLDAAASVRRSAQ